MQHLTRTFTFTLVLILLSPAAWGQRTLELDRAARTAGKLPLAKPEDAGMSSAKLLQAVARADTLIAEKKLAGAIVLVARHGKVVHRSTHGQMDIEAGKPMRENTIFRIYSMSKPIVSVAAMMLQEEGKLSLDAPIARYLPEMADLVVYKEGGGGLVSTAHDYMRFVLMLVNGGTLDGQRLLQRTTLERMTANQLPEKAMPVAFGPLQRTGIGFGYGFSVIVKKSPWDPAGRIGEYGWSGAASTHFWISPADDLAVITLEQTMPFSPLLESALKGPIYDAILTLPTHPRTPK